MRIIHYLADLLFKHQKKLEYLAFFLLFLTVSFRFNNSKTSWLWTEYYYIALTLVGIILIIALVWVRIEKNKTNELINCIMQERTIDSHKKTNLLNELSSRQKEVFDLIMSGKSNKEIMDTLSIELSTLKTHINKIYKILDIDSRKALKKLNDIGN
jgi:DNA-binding CsgD family transcriptional regulator